MVYKDPFRDTWIRYLGYANEVGEALRPVIPGKVVRWSYGVAFAYVLADTADKSIKAWRRNERTTRVIIETGDALIWQTLASVIIPGFTINRISYYSGVGLSKFVPSMPPKTRSLLMVGVGLASIPFIIKPIDGAVTTFMNLTYRKIF